jgi:hypothetical protein
MSRICRHFVSHFPDRGGKSEIMRSSAFTIDIIHEDIMPTPGPKAQTNPASAILSSTRHADPRANRDLTHVERHYKSIGITAVASALSILKGKAGPQPAKRDLPFMLRQDGAAA